jgi:hypothetical protein
VSEWLTIATLGDVDAYSDTTVEAGVEYEYRIIATNAAGDSDPSNVLSVLVEQEGYTGSGSAVVPAPSGVGAGTYAVPAYSGSGVATSPSAIGAGAGDYAVPVYSGSGTATAPAAQGAGSGEHVAPGFEGAGQAVAPSAIGTGAGTYTVPSYSGLGQATAPSATGTGAGTVSTVEYTGAGQAVSPAPTGTGAAGYLYSPDAPLAPVLLSATYDPVTDSVTLIWDKSTGATGYRVERDEAGIATVGDVNTYVDTNLT